MNPNDLGTQLICGLGILLAVLVAAWPVWSRMIRRPAPKAPPLQPLPVGRLEQEAQGRALALASLPFAHRVKAIHDLIINYENRASSPSQDQDT